MRLIPKHIVELEYKIEELKLKKNKVVKSQRYEEAARIRDSEKKLIEELEKAMKDKCPEGWAKFESLQNQ